MTNSGSIGFGLPAGGGYAQPLHGRPASNLVKPEGKGIDFSQGSGPITRGIPVAEGQPVLQAKAADGPGIVEPQADHFSAGSDLDHSQLTYGPPYGRGWK